jgi:hypothetical protein
MPLPVHFFTKSATPSVPPTNVVGLYVKSDGKFYYLLEDGTERELLTNATGVSLASALAAVYPVGSVYLSYVATDPNTLFGFGTWARIGEGRMLVGQKASDADFDTIGETGGSKTHTNTEAEMFPHTHTQDAHTHTQNSHNHTQDAHNHTQDPHQHDQENDTAMREAGSSWNDAAGFNLNLGGTTQATTATNQATTATNQATTATNQNTTATNQNTGGGAAYSIMNPYEVVYMWRRTA